MERLSKRAAKRLRELEQLLRCWDGESCVLGQIPEPLREILGAEKSAVYTLRTIGERTGVGDVASVGVKAMAEFEASMQSVTQGLVMYDPTRPARAQRNRAVTFEDLHRLKITSGSIEKASFWRANGLHRDDQLRVLLCEGPTAVAWAGAFQAGAEGIAFRTSSPPMVS